jgi:hypothetical protein
MEPDTQRDKIIDELEQLNAKMERQGKVSYQLREGILKGIGFFIGSAIIATILLGILGPIFGNIEWVRDTYEAGEGILRP